MTQTTTPATEHVASCYAPLVDGVPSRRHVEIRFDRRGPTNLPYVVATIDGSVADGHWRRGSRQTALELAASLGYPEILLADGTEIRSAEQPGARQDV